MEKKYTSWSDVERFVDNLCGTLEFTPTGVYGPPRGGSIFAVLISHRLNVPMLSAPADGCLIVDDICDSGLSMLHYQQKIRKGADYKIATMFVKPQSQVVPKYFGEEVPNDTWVVFPWEVDE